MWILERAKQVSARENHPTRAVEMTPFACENRNFIRYARLQCCPGLRALEYFRWKHFLFCYVLAGTGNLLDLWSFGRHLATVQVSVRIGKGRKILRLYYPYIDVFRVRYSNCCF